ACAAGDLVAAPRPCTPPFRSVTAVGLVVNCLLQSGDPTPAETAYLQVLARLFAATDGSALGIQADDGLFTPLTIIGGTIRMEDRSEEHTAELQSRSEAVCRRL